MSMKRFKISTVLGLALASIAVSHAEPCALAKLGWIAGAWKNTADPHGAQERWAIAPHDVLMGSAWEVSEGKAGYAELMTIRQSGEAISMVLRHFDGALGRAWEDREKPMIFTAARCTDGSVVFDGEGDHAGEHLTYQRTGNDLLITGDFLHHGTADHEE